MNLLIDTHVILWAANDDRRLSKAAKALLSNTDHDLYFSSASIWEIVIKRSLGRDDFACDPAILRRALLDNGWAELPVTATHALGVEALPDLHKDPFDRILIAQAQNEGLRLITSDERIAVYSGSILRV